MHLLRYYFVVYTLPASVSVEVDTFAYAALALVSL